MSLSHPREYPHPFIPVSSLKLLSLCVLDILFCFRFRFVVALQEEEIMEARAFRIKQLKHHLDMMEEQLDDHISGEREMPDDRLGSLHKRIAVYEEQLKKYTRDLTPEVGLNRVKKKHTQRICIAVRFLADMSWNSRGGQPGFVILMDTFVAGEIKFVLTLRRFSQDIQEMIARGSHEEL